MKIVYGITKRNFGGAQRYALDLATAATSKGSDASVLCGERGVLTEKLRQEQIPVVALPRLTRDVKLTEEIPVGIEVMKFLAKEKPKIFHINSSKMGGTGSFAV